MSIICSICSEHLTQTEDVIYTRCAHVFHARCLNTWLDRSKSCPQCREKVTRNKIRKLYFTFSNNDASVDTTEYQGIPLQEKVDSLKFQILLKEKDIQFQSSANITLKKQNAGLKQEVTKLEREISQKNAAIHALKEQIAYFKEESSKCEYLKSRIAQLKSKLGQLKPLQTLLYAPLSDVSKMIGDTKDPDVLITYISIMKKELIRSFDKYKRLKLTIKRFKGKLSANNTNSDISIEEQEQQVGLEEKLPASEIKNVTLQGQIIDELEAPVGTNNKRRDDVSLETKEAGSQSDSFTDQIPIEGVPNAKKQIISSKSSLTKRSVKRKVDKVSAHSAKSILHENVHTDDIEVTANNSDLELVSCTSSSGSIPMTSSTMYVRTLSSDSRSGNNDINCSAPRKKRRAHSKDNAIYKHTDTIDLT